jgi:hypothetical protein
MVNAYVIGQAIYVAAKLGIADLLAEGPQSIDALATAAQVHGPALYRILRTLASAGIFAERGDTHFELTPMAAWLRSTTPGSLRGWAIMRGEPVVWRSWGDLLHSVQTGQGAFEHVFGCPPFEYLGQHPDVAAMVDAAMRSMGFGRFEAVASAYDFSGVSTLVDVGGGNGGMLTAILKQHPQMQGILAELPHVVEGATQHLNAEGLSGRCQCLATNMFKQVPTGGEVYLLSRVIHDWNDARAEIILKNCRRAMSEGGRILLVESLLPPANTPHLSHLADLEMLVMSSGGKERSEREYYALYEAAGFRLTRVIPTSSPWSIVEGVTA